jgi:O6-methylguanine-DNA--protein-cysteine methyltransferase
MAANRFPLLIPCHRVVKSDGSLGGFSSPKGAADKAALLRFEGVKIISDKVDARFFYFFS